MGFVAESLGLGRLVPWSLARRTQPRRVPLPTHVRETIEDLGTTFIKLGQILSTRTDIVPPDYARELGRLQDRVPAVPSPVIRAVIAAELGPDADQILEHFDDVPLASASIAQVHRATLPSGDPVVVKVQKPGVAERVEADLSILSHLSHVGAAQHLTEDFVDLVDLVDEFSWVLRSELDYVREARSADRIARNFAGDPALRVPHVYSEFTTRRILVMEELHGIRIDDLAALERAGIDRRALALRSSRILLKSIFEHGFYQADPHPGNFLITPGGALAALDFGMMGQLGPAMRTNLLQFVLAIVDQDSTRVIDALETFGIAPTTAHHASLRRQMEHVLEEVSGQPLGQIQLAPLVSEVFSLARRYHMRLPTDLALLLKTLAMNEGVGRRLDPDFVATEAAGNYLKELALREARTPKTALRFLRSGADAVNASLRLPRRIERLITLVERGELRWSPHPKAVERLAAEWRSAINRVAVAITFAGVAATSALLAVFGRPSTSVWQRDGVRFGLAASAVLGLYTLLLVWRSGGQGGRWE